MKRILSLFCTAAVLMSGVALTSSCGTLNSEALLAGGIQAIQAATLSDSEVKAYVGQYIANEDKQNVVLG